MMTISAVGGSTIVAMRRFRARRRETHCGGVLGAEIRPSRPRRGCADQPSLAAPRSNDAWWSSAGAVKPNAYAGRPRTSSVDGQLVPLMRNVRTVRVGHHRRRPRTPRPDRPRSISSQDLHIGTPTSGIRRRHRRWTNAAQPAGRHARAALQAGTNHRYRLGAGTTARTMSAMSRRHRPRVSRGFRRRVRGSRWRPPTGAVSTR